MCFSFISFCIGEQCLNETLVLCSFFVFNSHLFLKSLLLQRSLKLILIFHRVSSHLLLPLRTLLISLSTHLSHLFLVLHLLLVSLKIKLDLVLGSSFRHFCFVLDGFTSFFFLDLCFLDLVFDSVVFVFELFGFFSANG